jgi:hypothetical protein
MTSSSTPGQISQKTSQPESQGSEPVSNLYILYQNDRLGGPYGIYKACCDDQLYERFSESMEILAIFPCQGRLLKTVHHRLKLTAVRDAVPWFDTSLEDIFSVVGDLMDNGLQEERVSHFVEMDQD